MFERTRKNFLGLGGWKKVFNFVVIFSLQVGLNWWSVFCVMDRSLQMSSLPWIKRLFHKRFIKVKTLKWFNVKNWMKSSASFWSRCPYKVAVCPQERSKNCNRQLYNFSALRFETGNVDWKYFWCSRIPVFVQGASKEKTE